MNRHTVAHETFVLERTFDVPVARTFRARADPRRKARWLAGSADAVGAGYALDFRVGGPEVDRGGPPDGPVSTDESVFRDIVPDEWIVSTYEMAADGVRISVSVATMPCIDDGGSSRLVLTEQGVFLDGHDAAAHREEGTRSLLDSLAATKHGADS